MKKFFTLLLLLIPVATFAASGACSGHGGVSCNAGSDSDGSVICNDGWRNSSVSYSSMKMCGGGIESTYTSEVIPEVVVPKASQPVQKEVVPTIKNTIAPEPIKVTPIVEVKKTPVEKPNIVAQPKIEISTSSKAVEVVAQKVAVKKKGFFSRLFGLFKIN